ncbi:alpha/beta hydrolase [Corallincola platygyrae]|uniref:Alpha/beta hydrolase n=2 Tax=Corallincola platygyrae TaxID=1193278 RepID=A0ABW4XGJ5_9GAMM
MLRAYLVALSLICLTGCSSNWAFYAPTHEISRSPDSYSYAYEEIWIDSESGNRLNAQIHFSGGSNPAGMVMHFHGNRGNITETFEKVEWLLDEGFDVVVFDYSGYGKSDGTPTPETTYLDARSMLSFLNKFERPNNHYKKIVWGTSLGGAIMMSGLSSSAESHDLELVIVDSSFYSYQKTAVHVVSQYPLGGLITWLPAIFVDDKYAPESRLDGLPDTPILFSHCDTDALIPMEFTKGMYDMASGQKALWILPGCKHARSFANEHPENQNLLMQVLDEPERISPQYTYAKALKDFNAQLLAVERDNL